MEEKSKVRGHFFRDGKRDKIEIKIIGDPNTVIRDVTPHHLAQFPAEWKAYSEGSSFVDVGGTDLTEIPGVTPDVATTLRLKGVRNAEEMAALDDAAAKGIGMQGLTWRRTAQLLMREKQAEAMQAVHEIVKRGPGRPPKQHDAEAA